MRDRAALADRGRRSLALAAFCVLAAAGLPILGRYLLLPAAIGAILCGAGAFGWMELPRGDRAAPAMGVVRSGDDRRCSSRSPRSRSTASSALRSALSRQDAIQDDLQALVHVPPGSIAARCQPIAVPNHRPVPLLALWLDLPPQRIRSLQNGPVLTGTYVRPATPDVAHDYILDPRDLSQVVPEPPPGFDAGGRQRVVGRLRALRLTRARMKKADRAPSFELGLRAPAPGRDSGSGTPATPAGDRLRLLPSGPDLVHGPTSRGTRAINASLDVATPPAHPSRGNSASLERIASDRAPLPPRLARSTGQPR